MLQVLNRSAFSSMTELQYSVQKVSVRSEEAESYWICGSRYDNEI
jgi:hypothetical protein